MPHVVRQETFNPLLLESESLAVSNEQRIKIREILEIGASDSRFAEKMYLAIERVLTGGNAVAPIITSLNPSSVVLGSPDFDVHVMGSGFDLGSIIVFAGVEEPTTFVSETELTTGVNMSLWVGPDAVPVSVLGSNGVVSDPVDFTFVSAAARGTGTKNKIGYPDKTETPIQKEFAPQTKTVAEEHHEKGK